MKLPVAKNWYQTQACSDGVTLIWEPHVCRHIRCNIWHIKGRDRSLLIDSGMGMASLRDTVSKLCDQPLLAVSSHCHFDHIGCQHEFEHRLCHPAEAEILSNPDNERIVWNSFNERLEMFLDGEPLLTALPHAGYRLEDYRVLPAAPSQLINDGDEIDLGNRLFKVFHMPGHSPGSLCLYEAASKTLFTGDVIYDDELLDDLYHSDPQVYLETLARLREIPAETFHCGHYGSIGRQRMLEIIDHYQHSKTC